MTGTFKATLASLAAAFLFAAGSVLEHRTAGRVKHEETMKFSLLMDLVRRPVWVCAVTLNLVAFVLQLLALRRGSLLVVQPLLVTGLLFALGGPIYAGTNEIQRNIIAERLLGLPREPK